MHSTRLPPPVDPVLVVLRRRRPSRALILPPALQHIYILVLRARVLGTDACPRHPPHQIHRQVGLLAHTSLCICGRSRSQCKGHSSTGAAPAHTSSRVVDSGRYFGYLKPGMPAAALELRDAHVILRVGVLHHHRWGAGKRRRQGRWPVRRDAERRSGPKDGLRACESTPFSERRCNDRR
eukprot:scaffold8697_cov113-Isochrysis_galbana.AAC.5